MQTWLTLLLLRYACTPAATSAAPAAAPAVLSAGVWSAAQAVPPALSAAGSCPALTVAPAAAAAHGSATCSVRIWDGMEQPETDTQSNEGAETRRQAM